MHDCIISKERFICIWGVNAHTWCTCVCELFPINVIICIHACIHTWYLCPLQTCFVILCNMHTHSLTLPIHKHIHTYVFRPLKRPGHGLRPYIHTFIHTCIHTYIHTNMPIQAVKCPLVVLDTARDPRTVGSQPQMQNPGVRFYAGAPLLFQVCVRMKNPGARFSAGAF